MNTLILNGELVSLSTFHITSENRAFAYGDGLFETIKVANNRVLFADRHIQRFNAGLKALQLNLPVVLTGNDLQNQVSKMISNDSTLKNSRVKLTAFRNDGGRYTPKTLSASYIITATPVENIAYTLNEKGVSVEVYTEIEKPYNAISSFKCLNSMTYVLAGIYASTKGLQDSLIINPRQQIIETINSNIFLIVKGEYYTPPVTSGCIDGVMRSVIITILREMGENVHETNITTEQLLAADEVFKTNVIQGIQWIGAFRQKRYYKTETTKLINEVNRRLFEPSVY